MSSSKDKKTLPHPRVSTTFIWIISLTLISAGILMGLIYTKASRVKAQDEVVKPDDYIEQGSAIAYDKTKILIDDTETPLEIIELSPLENN